MSIENAFHQVCEQAKAAGCYFVTLVVREPFYGGPEEGGWWGEDLQPVAYKVYHTLEAAEAAKAKVEVLAKRLSREARTEHGRHCGRELEWLEARGLDADFLPETAGPESYFVVVTKEEEYQPKRGCREWS
jgi:hypothetical protein